MPLRRRIFASKFARAAQALLIAGAVCFSLGAAEPGADQGARFNDIGRKLMCTCGCAQSLLGCDHVGCPNRGGEMDQLRDGVANGQSEAVILDGFVDRWGATVLGAPTTKGFDLLAWIMPFGVAAVALIGTILLVRNWARSQPKLAAAHTSISPAQALAEEEMRERIRRETGTDGEV
jgi:cytochrome c-type biogenesis protein CcmH